MGLLNFVGKILAGGKRQKGEKTLDYNRRAHQSYINDWMREKKASGRWLPKDEYERRFHRPGREDD